MTLLSLSCSRTCWLVASEDHLQTTSQSNEQNESSRLHMSYVDSLVLIDNSINQPQIDHGDFAWWGAVKSYLWLLHRNAELLLIDNIILRYQLYESVSVIKKRFFPLPFFCNAFDVNANETGKFMWMQIIHASTENKASCRLNHVLHKSSKQNKKHLNANSQWGLSGQKQLLQQRIKIPYWLGLPVMVHYKNISQRLCYPMRRLIQKKKKKKKLGQGRHFRLRSL